MGAASNKSRPILYIFSGLPGVGKSRIARELARRIGAVYFRVDSAENALKNSSLNISPAEDAGYEIGYALAKDNLDIGLDFVADCVNPIQLTRDAWRQVGRISIARIIEIEVICTDLIQHKSMVEGRLAEQKDIENPNWNKVISRHYEARTDDRIIIDTHSINTEEAISKIRQSF